MPTIFTAGPYRFYFYSHEPHEPPHIHVQQDECVAKVWLTPVTLAANYGFTARELNGIVKQVKENRDLLLEAWHGYFGRTS